MEPSVTPVAKPAVAVLGAGSWGTALAALIARHDHRGVTPPQDRAVVVAPRWSARSMPSATIRAT